MHMHSSHHSITLNAPKNNYPFFYKILIFFLLCVARDSNVNLYVLMWSPRQQKICFCQCIIYFNQHVTCFFFIIFTSLTMFTLFFIFNMFYFNCCLNKIFVIVIVIVTFFFKKCSSSL